MTLLTVCSCAFLSVYIAVSLLPLDVTATRRGGHLTIYLTNDAARTAIDAIAAGTLRRYAFLQSINSPMDWGGFAYDSRYLSGFP
jgi:hypothetical protein